MKKIYVAPEAEIVRFELAADILTESGPEEQITTDHIFVTGNVGTGFGW